MSSKIELVVRGNDPAEFAKALRGLSALFNNGKIVPAPGLTISGGALSEDESKSWVAQAAETAPVEDKPATPEPAPQAEAPAESAPWEESPTVPTQYNAPTASMVAVREALVPLIQAGKQKEVQELFKRFGGTKLSDIPEDKLGELLAAVEELTA